MARLSSSQIKLVSNKVAKDINDQLGKVIDNRIAEFIANYDFTRDSIARTISNVEELSEVVKRLHKEASELNTSIYEVRNTLPDKYRYTPSVKSYLTTLWMETNQSLRLISPSDIEVELLITGGNLDYDSLLKSIKDKVFKDIPELQDSGESINN